ncbi:MAG: protein phosphatase 2C domain-containing protein [Granulosicoccaceae bacterium]|jgi:serine/threonine protein phosphatase PrpC
MKVVTAQTNRLGNREMNQDRMTVIESDASILLVVADGMGGHAGGEIAAEIVVDTLSKHFQSSAKPIRNPRAFLGLAIEAAHRHIVSSAQSRPAPFDPRTTCVTCLVQGQHAWWAHVGDSRLYLLQGNSITQHTEDHSYVQDLYRQGEISKAEMASHPMRNYLTRCLGGDTGVPQIAYGECDKLQANDMLVLCSDGFWSQLGKGQIETLLDKQDIDTHLNELANLAEKHAYPQSDNISAVALRWLGLGDAAADMPHKQQAVVQETGDNADDTSLNEAIDAITRALEQYSDEMKH